MTINATEILSAVAPWELSIQVGGTVYRTRPPTFGEMFAASASPAAGNEALTPTLSRKRERGKVSEAVADLGRLRTIVSSWLGGASVDELSGDELGVIVAAVAAYAAARSKKNQAAIAAAIAGQIE